MELMEFHGTFLRLFRDFELLVHFKINRYYRSGIRVNNFYNEQLIAKSVSLIRRKFNRDIFSLL